MTTYIELKMQADELMRQAEALRAEERNEVIASVRETVTDWKITAAELGFKGAREKRKLPAKYRDPVSGKEWCGKGAMPRWLSAYLEAGHTREQYLI